MSNHSAGTDPHRILGSMLLLPVLGGVVATAVLVSSLLRSGRSDNAQFRYWSADRAAMVAAERWVVSAKRDSMRSWASTLRTKPDSLVVRVDAGVPAVIAQMTDSMLRAEWKGMAVTSPEVRVAAVVQLDTERLTGELKRPRERLPLYFVPTRTDERTCVAVIRIAREVVSEPELLLHNATIAGINRPSLGPCAFFAALGMPGDGARQWLARVGKSHAVEAHWWEASDITAANVGTRATTVATAPDSALNTSSRTAYQDRLAEALRSPRIAACRGGNESACGGLVDPGHAAFDDAGYILSANERLTPPPGVLMPVTFAFRVNAFAGLLSDLVRDAGVERAGRAWRGNDGFMSALATASGTTTGALGAKWMSRALPSVHTSDVALNPAAISMPLLLGALLIALALGTVRTRERT